MLKEFTKVVADRQTPLVAVGALPKHPFDHLTTALAPW
jgi:hypothetical protein